MIANKEYTKANVDYLQARLNSMLDGERHTWSVDDRLAVSHILHCVRDCIEQPEQRDVLETLKNIEKSVNLLTLRDDIALLIRSARQDI